jgi:hypothetical protein
MLHNALQSLGIAENNRTEYDPGERLNNDNKET